MSRPPEHTFFKRNDPATKAAASKGGKATAEVRRERRLAKISKTTLLQRLAPLALTDMMERLGLGGQSWRAWRVIAKVIDGGAGLTRSERQLFTQLTGRRRVPKKKVRELWVIAGRRSGKTTFDAALAVHRATRRYPKLSRGESVRILALACDREQAEVLHDYVVGMFDGDEELRQLVVRRKNNALTLAHKVIVQVATSSYRRVRGYTCALVAADEIAYWWSDEQSRNPDVEILRALRPSLATIRASLLVCSTTPHARRGAAWKAFEQHYGNEDSAVLVVKAPTRLLNPTVDEEVIAAAEEEDPEAARAEWHAEFRRDIESFLSVEAVEGVTVEGCHELPPLPGVRYYAFVDPSGGSKDSFALGIAHAGEEGKALLDVVREAKPPFSPDAEVARFAELLRQYRCATVTGDKYGGEWVVERFAKHGIEYVSTAYTKSQLYGELLPAINSSRVSLLDNSRLRRQFLGLERRTSRGAGRDSIDHAPGGHDDLSNVAAGSLTLALPGGQGGGGQDSWPLFRPGELGEEYQAWAQQQRAGVGAAAAVGVGT